MLHLILIVAVKIQISVFWTAIQVYPTLSKLWTKPNPIFFLSIKFFSFLFFFFFFFWCVNQNIYFWNEYGFEYGSPFMVYVHNILTRDGILREFPQIRISGKMLTISKSYVLKNDIPCPNNSKSKTKLGKLTCNLYRIYRNNNKIHEPHHTKTGLNMFVVAIPKEGLAGPGPAKPSLGITPSIELYSTVFTDYVL